ncbi:MAG: alpha-L-fucosidase [Puniceicoccales bacterium]|jgi:alpha-L-fucosidase|nr:alpha-L-fucosidase [Puniceicoccales bacterium]
MACLTNRLFGKLKEFVAAAIVLGAGVGVFRFSIPDIAADTSVRYEAKWASLDKRPVPEWYRDAKFGIFIHWGLYSVPAYERVGEYSEWYWRRLSSRRGPLHDFHNKTYGANFRYEDFAPLFKAELFDAKQWAKLFKRAGAKYIVPTSKHHDGFALWPSAEASKTWGRPWNATEIGPKRDLLGELANAVRAEGIQFGFYYSFYEWFNPLWLKDKRRFVEEHFIPQFKDVITRYKPALLFNDGEWDLPAKFWRSEELLAWLYNESPCREYVVANDRWGKETRHHHGDYYTTEYGAGMPDGKHPWEESRGMGFSYGYNRAERAEHYKTSGEFILMLADFVSRGGNLLLNIGPAADGTIPPIMEQRLLDIGAWLEINGDAIYGTRTAGRSCQWTSGKQPSQRYGTFKVRYDILKQSGQVSRDGNAVKQVFFTQKGDTLYAITAGRPAKTLTLHNVKIEADTRVSLLGGGELAFKNENGNLVITLPEILPEKLQTQPALALKITKAKAGK